MLGFYEPDAVLCNLQLQDAMKRAAERDSDIAIKAAAMRAKTIMMMKRRALDGFIRRWWQTQDMVARAGALRCVTKSMLRKAVALDE